MQQKFSVIADFKPAGDQGMAISSLVRGINEGLAYQTLLGVTGSGKTYTIANVIAELKRPTIVLVHNKTLAAQLYGEFKNFFPKNAVEYFVSYYDYYQPEAYVPSSDTYIEKDASINEHIEQMRLSATKSLITRKDTIIVATVSAIYGLGDPESYLKMMLHIQRGEEIDQRAILRRLAELQYTRNDIELARGTFRVHGDIIDIYPADSDRDAVRVELFGDEIDNICSFDPLTGHIIEKLPRVTIFPKTHYVTPREKLLKAVDYIKVELKERLQELKEQNKLVEEQRLAQRTQYDLEMILELGYCSGIENYSRYLSGRKAGEPPPTLLDYLPDNALIVVDESHVTIPQLGAMYKGDRARKENLVNYGFRLPSALDNRPLKFEEFLGKSQQSIFVSATPGNFETEKSGEIVEQLVRPTGLLDPEIEIRKAATQVDDLLSEINTRVANKERVLVTTLTKKMAENLTEYYAEHGVLVRYLHSDIDTVERVELIKGLRSGEFDVLVGINLLREGLDMPEVSLVAILDADKEGFLRSDKALIQTMGRAARNVKGKAILYADKMTGSIERAVAETDRRRVIQEAYNKEHGITPKSIIKSVKDILEAPGKKKSRKGKKLSQYEELKKLSMSPDDAAHKIKVLEEAMHQHAKDLEFEQAANCRDEIKVLHDVFFGLNA